MRLVITGALGHIGSKFIHALDARDIDSVMLIDNLCTQRYPSLFNLPDGVNFIFVEGDILTLDLETLFSGYDAILHFAAITDAPSSFDRKQEVEAVNFEGTRRVAEACLKQRSALFFPSTTSVYGTQGDLVDESCSSDELAPQSPYAEFKLKSEKELMTMAQENGLRVCIGRFGTIFGPSVGMRFHTAVNKFCWQAVMGQPLTVWKTAYDQKRPYLGLDDAVLSLKHILKASLFQGEVYNILSGNYTVREVIDTIQDRIPDISIEFVESEIMNQLSYEVCAQKFTSTGFEFTDTLNNGISSTIGWLSQACST